jgi:hypothetical protein
MATGNIFSFFQKYNGKRGRGRGERGRVEWFLFIVFPPFSEVR